jgi:hypothetical protein
VVVVVVTVVVAFFSHDRWLEVRMCFVMCVLSVWLCSDTGVCVCVCVFLHSVQQCFPGARFMCTCVHPCCVFSPHNVSRKRAHSVATALFRRRAKASSGPSRLTRRLPLRRCSLRSPLVLGTLQRSSSCSLVPLLVGLVECVLADCVWSGVSSPCK